MPRVPAAAPTAAAVPAAPERPLPSDPPRRRLSVPVVMLSIGVVLLSVAAVFYVVYAFVTYGLLVRAAITGGVTLAAFVASAILSRRRLVGTAEAVGAVGVVLLHLDVWAVRAYDLGGAGSAEPFAYFGVGTLLASAVLLASRPVIRVRSAGLAAWAGLPVAAGLLVAAVPALDAGTRTAFALAAASAVALLHAMPRARALVAPDALERLVLRITGVASAAFALVAGAASAADRDAVPALPLLVAAAAAGAHAWILSSPSPSSSRTPSATDPQEPTPEAAVVETTEATEGAGARPLRVLAAAVAGTSAALAVPMTAITGGPVLLTLCGQVAAAALVVAVLDVAARQITAPRLAGSARVARAAAGVVAIVAALPVALSAAGGVAGAAIAGLPPWALGPGGDPVLELGRDSGILALEQDARAASLGLVLVWLLAAGASAVGPRTAARRGPLAWSGACVVVAAVPPLGPLAAVVAAYVAVAVAASVLRFRVGRTAVSATTAPDAEALDAPVPAGRPRPLDPRTAPLTALGIAAGSMGWLASWGSAPTWWSATPVLLALLVASSRAARTDGVRRLSTVTAVLVALVSVAALAPSLRDAGTIGPAPASADLGPAADPTVLVLAAAGLLLLGAGILRSAPGVRRRAALATALLPALLASVLVSVSGAEHAGGSLTAAPVWPIVAQVLLVAALASWTVGGRARRPLPAPVAPSPLHPAPPSVPSVPSVAHRAVEPGGPAPTGRMTSAISQAPIGSPAPERGWRLATAVLLAPVLLAAVVTIAALVPSRGDVPGAVPAAVALAVALLGRFAYLRTSSALRVALDAGAGAVGAVGLLVAVAGRAVDGTHDRLWIPLLILAVTALVLASAADGLLLSRSVRRAWAWTAFGIGIAALWARLLAGDVRLPEAYVLPVAGTLLLVAALVHRAALRVDAHEGEGGGPRVRRGVSALVLAGILTAALPLAPAGRADDVIRPLALTVVLAVLALAPAALMRRAPGPVRPLLRATVAGGGLGLLAVGATRALRLPAEYVDRTPAVDVQLIVTALLLGATGVLALRAARDSADTQVAGTALAAVPVLTALVLVLSVRPGQGVVRPLVAAVLLVSLTGLLLALRSSHRRTLDLVAAVAHVAVVVVALSAWRGASPVSDAGALAVPAVVAVLVAALGAAERLRRHTAATDGTPSLSHAAADVAVGLLTAITVATAGATDARGLPSALLLSATAVVLVALDPRSAARRRMGWVALALGAAALWVALGRGAVEAVEPYVLPLAGVLLLVAAALELGLPARLRLARRPERRRASGAPLVLAALLLAVVPTAVASWGGDPVRALVLGGVGGVGLILVAASLGRLPVAPGVTSGATATDPRALLLATAGPAALAVLLVGYGRPLAQLVQGLPPTIGRTDLWSLAAGIVLVLAVALHGQTTGHATASPDVPGDARPRSALAALEAATPRALALVSVLATAGVGTAAIVIAHEAVLAGTTVRSAVLVALLGLLHVAAADTRPRPAREDDDRRTGSDALPAEAASSSHALRDVGIAVTALVAAVLASGVLAATGAADPVEWVAVPVALALLVVGARRLSHDARAGSMRHLSPGLLVLLVPPLLADLGPSPAWRIVGLGAVALATLLVGASRRLRAPFLIGSAVLLVHAVAQLWPWIRDASATVPWWAWAGIGGVVLIAVAARYERRVRDLREVAARVSALR
ncbi:SCO7613 C-terminal domain-containing membrane protein [Clavibacter sp. Sh2141]